jgi:uncharacterized protein (TIGR03437 family)
VLANFTSQNVALDSAGNIYAPVFSTNTVQKIFPSGTTLWIGGDGATGWSGDGSAGTSANMAEPYGVAVDKSGNVYVAEATNAIIRELTPVPFSIGAISNAATIQPFAAASSGVGDATVPIAPGEIVAIFGTGLGPANLVSNTPTNGVFGTQLAGTTVMIGGTAAPIIYTSANLVSAIVPYEVNGQTSVNVYVNYQGQPSVINSVPVAPTAPGIFTLNASGSGQALAVNLNGTLNSVSNPTPVGNYLILYETGEGQTTPSGVDGMLAPTSPTAVYPMPLQTVTATVGGLPAFINYAGAAPGFVAGVLQINVQIPVGVPSGSADVQVSINNLVSPVVTIAVQ